MIPLSIASQPMPTPKIHHQSNELSYSYDETMHMVLSVKKLVMGAKLSLCLSKSCVLSICQTELSFCLAELSFCLPEWYLIIQTDKNVILCNVIIPFHHTKSLHAGPRILSFNKRLCKHINTLYCGIYHLCSS